LARTNRGLVAQSLGTEPQDQQRLHLPDRQPSVQVIACDRPVVGGNNSFVGGLGGADTDNDSSSQKIAGSYSTGSVTGGSGAFVGGLIGKDLAQSATANAYWDLDTSDIGNSHRVAGNIPDDPASPASPIRS